MFAPRNVRAAVPFLVRPPVFEISIVPLKFAARALVLIMMAEVLFLIRAL